MIEKIQALKEQIEALSASNAEELEALRIKYLSKKGEITALFNDFRNVPNEQKREIGQKLNELKTLATDKINAIREAFNANAVADVDIDLTRTSAPQEIGTRHPISLVRKEIIDIFYAKPDSIEDIILGGIAQKALDGEECGAAL